MARKVCRVTGLDFRGLPLAVLVEADSLFEAAAAGIEQVHKQKGLLSEVQIEIQEPGRSHRVHPRQLEAWLRTHETGDSVGVRALKSRVRDILNNNPQR